MSDTAPLEVITINGQEISLEDAGRYIELGRGREKIESDLNTSLDKVYPEFTRTAQEKKDLAEKLAAKEAELEELKKPKVTVQEPEDAKTIVENARKYGITTESYLKEQGYMTKAEVDEYFNQRLTQDKLAERILQQCDEYETKIDGSDGRVPFDKQAVLAYANTFSINDPLEAYNQMNKKGNAKWEAAQLAAAERPGLTTLRQGGKKVPQAPKITSDNLKDQLGGWLDEAGLGQE